MRIFSLFMRLPRAILIPTIFFAIAIAFRPSTPHSAAGQVAATGTPVAQPAPSAAPVVASTTGAAALRAVFPGAAKPAGLVAQRAVYTIAVAQQQPGLNQWGVPVPIGSQVVESRTSAFGSLPDAALATTLPRGDLVETWSFDIDAQHAGQHVFLLRLSTTDGSWTSARAAVDGQATPVAAVELGQGGAAAGAVDLGTGWHAVAVEMTHRGGARKPGAVTAALFVRGPVESAPASVTPYAVVPEPTRAASAPPATASASSVAQIPAAAVAGGAK